MVRAAMAQEDTKRDDDSKDADDGTKPSEAPKKESSPPAKSSTPPEKQASTPPAKASSPPAKQASTPPAAEEEDDEDEEDDEEDAPKGDPAAAADDEEDEDEEDEPEEAPAPAKAATPAKKEPAKDAPAKRATPAAAASPVRKRAPLPPEPPPIAVGKTVFLFVAVIGALSAGFWFLGGETGGDRTAPRWKTGQTVDVNITLVAGDRNDLACATEVAIADRKCEFQTKTKATEPKPEDGMLLKPYTTTDGVQFLAAGLWSQPELDPKKLPADRFSVKCKYTVEGEVKKPAVRWAVRGGFSDKDNAWYAGTVKDCALSP
jgi:hypothetical protein